MTFCLRDHQTMGKTMKRERAKALKAAELKAAIAAQRKQQALPLLSINAAV